VGDTFNSKTYGEKEVLAVYTDFETNIYDGDFIDDGWLGYSDVPWWDERENVTSVIVEDPINPISTSLWFANFNNCHNFNLTKLDTQGITDMSYMFYGSGVVDASSLTMPTSLETIGWMFRDSTLRVAPIIQHCENLSNLEYAFYWTQIEVMPTLPNNIENAKFAFSSCQNLHTASIIQTTKDELNIEGNLNAVTDDLYLPVKGKNKTVISWHSSDESGGLCFVPNIGYC
jgi:hypothetical protein